MILVRRWRFYGLLFCLGLFLLSSRAWADEPGRAQPLDDNQTRSETREQPEASIPAEPVQSPSETEQWAVEFFPDRGRAFKALQADPREARFRLGFMAYKGDTFEDLGLGGDLGLLWVGASEGGELTLTARGLFTARFDIFSESFDLQNTDFIGGATLGWRNCANSLELFGYHQSSHLGDEIQERGERKRIDYSRETIRLLWSYNWKKLRFYLGPALTVHAWPVELQGKLDVQAGVEYNFSLWFLDMFIAGDAQALGAHDYFVNTTGQLGAFLGSREKTRNRQWIFFEIFQGHSAMGQFYDRWESYLMIGVGYQFN